MPNVFLLLTSLPRLKMWKNLIFWTEYLYFSSLPSPLKLFTCLFRLPGRLQMSIREYKQTDLPARHRIPNRSAHRSRVRRRRAIPFHWTRENTTEQAKCEAWCFLLGDCGLYLVKSELEKSKGQITRESTFKADKKLDNRCNSVAVIQSALNASGLYYLCFLSRWENNWGYKSINAHLY